jgi:methionyl aminopeptidase
VGAISDANARLCRVTFEALHLGLDQARHRRRVGDIGYAVQRHCEAHGYGVVRDLVGHGIGRELHESPQVPNFGKRAKGKRLKRGLTICIEPMVNRGPADVTTDNDGWTIRAADSQPSAHYEHMVAVQPDGPPEILSTFGYIEDEIDAPYRASADEAAAA